VSEQLIKLNRLTLLKRWHNHSGHYLKNDDADRYLVKLSVAWCLWLLSCIITLTNIIIKTIKCLWCDWRVWCIFRVCTVQACLVFLPWISVCVILPRLSQVSSLYLCYCFIYLDSEHNVECLWCFSSHFVWWLACFSQLELLLFQVLLMTEF